MAERHAVLRLAMGRPVKEDRLPASSAARWVWAAGIIALYVLSGKLGLYLAFTHASATDRKSVV